MSDPNLFQQLVREFLGHLCGYDTANDLIPDQLSKAMGHAAAFARFHESACSDPELADQVARGVAQELIGAWEAGKTEERHLRMSITPMVNVLNDLVPDLAQVRRRLRELIGFDGENWNILQANWRDVDWNGLEKVSELVRSDSSITRLSQIVGRGFPVDPEEGAQIEKEGSPAPGRTAGFDGPSKFYPSPFQLALIADPRTEPLGLHLFAGRSTPIHNRKRTFRRRGTTAVTEQESSGPILICLDTSGSMMGAGTLISRTFSLAIASMAHENNRSAFLFVNTGSLQILEITRPEESLVPFSRYLGSSDIAGTDLAPPLGSALNYLEAYNRDFESHKTGTDVVLVSDFHLPTIAPRHLNRMFALQAQSRTRFHILTVAHQPMEDPLHIFDYQWYYNTDEHSQKGIPLEAFRGL